MAGNVKGITIEFRGDTTRLDKALRQINTETRNINKELERVDKALKFNPTSVELWKQKQELLTQKVSETKEKLELLKNEQKRMDAERVDENSEEYRKLQREIIETESKCKHFEGQLRRVGNVKLKAASESVKELGNKLTSAGEAMRGISTAAAAVTAAIGALTVKSGIWADDLNTMSKRYSIGTKDLQMYAAAADLVDTDVEAIAKSHVKLEKTMLTASKGTGASAEAFKKLGVDVVDADGNLRDGDTVWQETIEALGEMTNETERDALAMQLMGKSASELNPLIEDGGETYKNLAETMKKYGLDFIDQETLDRANEFNDELDTIKAVGLIAFQQLGTQLAAYLAPAMEKVVDLVGKLANWFSNLSPRTQAIIAGIAAVVAVMSPLLIGLGKLAFAISSIISLVGTVGPVIGGALAAAAPIVAVIAGIIAVGVLLYKNWDKIKERLKVLKKTMTSDFNALKTLATRVWNGIKNAVTTAVNNIVNGVKTKFNNLKTSVKNIFDNVKKAITHPIETAVDIVKKAIAKIEGFFSGANFSLPHIKLPHFKLTGKFSLKDKTVPSLSVDWYRTGGIFNSPSIIGVGEAGSEAVVPLDRFWDKLDDMKMGETNIVININGSNSNPREIAEEVKRVLIRETNQRRLAWQ